VIDVLRDAIVPRNLRASRSTSAMAIGLAAALVLFFAMMLLLFLLNPHR
jgi:hypothetical protein